MMKRVAVLPWPGIDGAYLCLSGRQRSQHDEAYYQSHRELYPEVWRGHSVQVDPNLTFTVQVGDAIAEWEPSHGPIQLWFRRDREDGDRNWRQHWFFDFAYGDMCWSQLAVDDNGLPQAFIDGDYDRIFAVLRRWAAGGRDPERDQGP